MLSRRGLFGVLSGLTAAFTVKPVIAAPVETKPLKSVILRGSLDPETEKLHHVMLEHFGEELYMSWMQTLDVDTFDGETLTVSFPVKFLRRWVQSHFAGEVEMCARRVFPGTSKVEYVLRQPGSRKLAA